MTQFYISFIIIVVVVDLFSFSIVLHHLHYPLIKVAFVLC